MRLHFTTIAPLSSFQSLISFLLHPPFPNHCRRPPLLVPLPPSNLQRLRTTRTTMFSCLKLCSIGKFPLNLFPSKRNNFFVNVETTIFLIFNFLKILMLYWCGSTKDRSVGFLLLEYQNYVLDLCIILFLVHPVNWWLVSWVWGTPQTCVLLFGFSSLGLLCSRLFCLEFENFLLM